MKTVGQLIRSERISQNRTVESLSLATKIDVKYIEAIESDRYDLLPSETFAKGFIRNITKTLGCNPDEYVAIFRRDYRHPELSSVKKSRPQKHGLMIQSLSSRYLPIVLGVIVFLVYLGFQFRVILTPPKLTLDTPQSGAVLASPVSVSGITASDALVTVNEDNVVKPDQDGKFQMSLSLPVGETSISIKSTNRFSRSTTIQVPLTVISN